MLKLRYKPKEIEAFRVGIDEIPEWFREAELQRKAIVNYPNHKYGEKVKPIAVLVNIAGGVKGYLAGDYIFKVGNVIDGVKADDVSSLFDVLGDDEDEKSDVEHESDDVAVDKSVETVEKPEVKRRGRKPKAE